jgi:hypothetical protein
VQLIDISLGFELDDIRVVDEEGMLASLEQLGDIAVLLAVLVDGMLDVQSLHLSRDI